jgi:hypothetical protein
LVIRKLQKNGKTYHGPSRDGIDNEPLDVALLYLQEIPIKNAEIWRKTKLSPAYRHHLEARGSHPARFFDKRCLSGFNVFFSSWAVCDKFMQFLLAINVLFPILCLQFGLRVC